MWIESIALRIRLILLGLLLIAQLAESAPITTSCATDSRLVAPCFAVHGRLNSWNGTPTYRIWVLGTKRVLGVSEGRFGPNGYELLPREIPQPTSFDTEYFGDFTVCPFEPEQPKKMRLVCVSAVNHLRIVDRK
jgi:hypothetical protein